MYRKICLVLLCIITVNKIFAQQQSKPLSEKDQKKQERKQHINDLIKREEEGALIYNRQSVFGFKLNTDGWSALYEHGKYKTINTTNTWFIEFGERKSHKEEKVQSDYYSGFSVGNPFIYGKQNNFYNLNFGIGQQKLLGGKGDKNGVAVSAIYGGGFSAGLLKPYYVTIVDPNTSETRDVKYQGSGDTLFLNIYYLVSGAGLTKGISETKLVPGVVAHAGLRFDYGRYNELLSALEIGVSGEFYTQNMPIMVHAPEKKFFYNAYIAIEFGSRK
ncbi:MAG: hypothetical protein JO072_16890 [Parafilimonas sp.]|nr:hypothetical protein [Parafilimonas sp.]